MLLCFGAFLAQWQSLVVYLWRAIAWREQRPLYSGTNPDLRAGFLVCESVSNQNLRIY